MVKLNTKFNKILAVMLSLLIIFAAFGNIIPYVVCLLYTSPSPRDRG